MLLRRMSEHVKAQNWFAVVLDFLIVVTGVFIGIQVANWNEGRVERDRERIALAALLDETEDNTSYIDLIITGALPRQRDRDAAVAMLHGEDPGEGDPVNGLLILSVVRDMTPIRSAYEELTASGDISLIRDPNIRRALALTIGVQLYNDRRRADAIAIIPNVEALASPYLTYALDPEVPRARTVTVDWEAARQDDALVNAATRALAIQRDWEARWDPLLQQTVGACLLIADALGTTCEPDDWVGALARGETVEDEATPLTRIDDFLEDWRRRNGRDGE